MPFGTRGGLRRAAPLPVRRRIPDDGDADLRRQHVAHRLRLGAVRAHRDAARRRAPVARGLGGRRPAGGGQLRRRAARRSAPTNVGGQAGPEAFFGGRGGAPMRVRFKTTAGTHDVGATFLATNFAPLLDLDKHFMRDTLQTGPTPGYTFFPHVGTIRIEGPFQATQAGRLAEPPQDVRLHAEGAGRRNARARAASSRTLATNAFRRPATAGRRRRLLMEFYTAGRKEKDFDAGIEMVLARVLASPQFLYRIEEEPATVQGRPGLPDQRHRPGVAPVVLPVEHGARRRAAARRQPGPAAQSGGARAAGAPDAEGPEGRGAGRELRRPVAEPARARRHVAAAAHLPGLRRSAAPGDAPRGGAAVRHASCARTAASSTC